MQIFLFLISQILLHRTGFNHYIVRNKTNYLCPVNKQRPLIMFLYIPVEQLTKSEVWTLHYAAVAATKTTNRPFQSGLVCSYAPYTVIFSDQDLSCTRNSFLPFVKIFSLAFRNVNLNISKSFFGKFVSVFSN